MVSVVSLVFIVMADKGTNQRIFATILYGVSLELSL